MDLNAQAAQIETKISLLAAKLKDLRAENERLKTENENLIVEQAKQNKRIGVLTTKLEETQRDLERQKSGAPQSAEGLREQLDQYINELDEVIDWLQQD